MFSITLIAIIGAVVLLDQISKNYIVNTLIDGSIELIDNAVIYNEADPSEISIIPNILYFKFTANTGISFSLFNEGGTVIISLITAILILICLYVIFARKLTDKLSLISLSLIVGGGLGNLIDRMFLGYVVDFIDVRCINFAIFNVADIAITCGSILLCLSVLLESKGKTDNQNG